MTNLIVAINNSVDDLPYGTSGVDWIDLSLSNDYLIFSNGSLTVADGKLIPSSSDLNQAGVIISEVAKVIVPKYFLADISDGILKEIKNAGNQNKRYVFAFDFDGETSSEPVLEIWDNANLNSIDLDSLGAGDESASWFWGITTTTALPGAIWIGDSPLVGHRLAGSAENYFLWLNNGLGALATAKTLYCQLKIIIPVNIGIAGLNQPCICIKYTSI